MNSCNGCKMPSSPPCSAKSKWRKSNKWIGIRCAKNSKSDCVNKKNATTAETTGSAPAAPPPLDTVDTTPPAFVEGDPEVGAAQSLSQATGDSETCVPTERWTRAKSAPPFYACADSPRTPPSKNSTSTKPSMRAHVTTATSSSCSPPRVKTASNSCCSWTWAAPWTPTQNCRNNSSAPHTKRATLKSLKATSSTTASTNNSSKISADGAARAPKTCSHKWTKAGPSSSSAMPTCTPTS